jgi:cytoskeletal protein CcmA (bactofilin family)
MIKRNEKEKQSGSISTLIGEDARIEGHLDFDGTLRLDGRLEGQMTSNNGILIVGEKARITADVNVLKAVVMGEITGSVTALDKIELYPPARITGDICAPTITIESGAMLNGKCIMQKPENTQSTSPLATDESNPVPVESDPVSVESDTQ